MRSFTIAHGPATVIIGAKNAGYILRRGRCKLAVINLLLLETSAQLPASLLEPYLSSPVTALQSADFTLWGLDEDRSLACCPLSGGSEALADAWAPLWLT